MLVACGEYVTCRPTALPETGPHVALSTTSRTTRRRVTSALDQTLMSKPAHSGSPVRSGSMSASIPDLGELLQPVLSGLSPELFPAFLARLELFAADRYHTWARELPAWSGELLSCADAENEIANRMIAAFAVNDEDVAMFDERLVAAQAMYHRIFEALPLREQFAAQALAERQGADAWRSMAGRSGLASALRDELVACSLLEERSADTLDRLLLRPHPQASSATTSGVVTHSAERELEGWTTASGSRLTWRTLISGDRDGSRTFAAGVTEVPHGPDAVTVHRHEPDELYHVISGSGSVVIDGTEHPVMAGSTVLVPGGAWHGVRNPGTDPIRLFYVFPTASFTNVVYEYPEGAPSPTWDSAD